MAQPTGELLGLIERVRRDGGLYDLLGRVAGNEIFGLAVAAAGEIAREIDGDLLQKCRRIGDILELVAANRAHESLLQQVEAWSGPARRWK